MPDPAPLILTSPELTIDAQSLKCLMSHIEITPDVTVVEVKTSCGVKEYPGTVKWTLKASLYHSYDPVGTNKILTDAVDGGVPVDFTVLGDSNQPASATNPEYTGQVIPQSFTPIAGDIGDASSFDLEWSIVGWGVSPTINIVPGAQATEAKAKEKASA
jgi:hypothetical protein